MKSSSQSSAVGSERAWGRIQQKMLVLYRVFESFEDIAALHLKPAPRLPNSPTTQVSPYLI